MGFADPVGEELRAEGGKKYIVWGIVVDAEPGCRGLGRNFFSDGLSGSLLFGPSVAGEFYGTGFLELVGVRFGRTHPIDGDFVDGQLSDLENGYS